MVRAADQFQQQRAWLALPVAVAKKYADNRAWDLAALIAYYAFLAIFPLLLILATVLNLVLHGDSGLRHRVLDSALAHYPIIGPQLATSALSGLASSGGGLLAGVGLALLALTLSLALNIAMFWLGFRFAAVSEISWRRLLPGAVISALAWQIMQTIGGYLVTHQLARSSNLYGTFAIVLGLISWLYLEALLTVGAVEVNAVLAYRLWPRSLMPPRTASDRRAYVLYAEVENRGEDQLIRTAKVFSSAELDSAAWHAPASCPGPV